MTREPDFYVMVDRIGEWRPDEHLSARTRAGLATKLDSGSTEPVGQLLFDQWAEQDPRKAAVLNRTANGRLRQIDDLTDPDLMAAMNAESGWEFTAAVNGWDPGTVATELAAADKATELETVTIARQAAVDAVSWQSVRDDLHNRGELTIGDLRDMRRAAAAGIKPGTDWRAALTAAETPSTWGEAFNRLKATGELSPKLINEIVELQNGSTGPDAAWIAEHLTRNHDL